MCDVHGVLRVQETTNCLVSLHQVQIKVIIHITYAYRGPCSSVGIANGYGLNGPWIGGGGEFPVGARFSAPVQTGPGAHPASCTMGTGSFPGVENGQGVTLTPHPLLVSRPKNRIKL
jgi:hypothetical protein